MRICARYYGTNSIYIGKTHVTFKNLQLKPRPKDNKNVWHVTFSFENHFADDFETDAKHHFTFDGHAAKTMQVTYDSEDKIVTICSYPFNERTGRRQVFVVKANVVGDLTKGFEFRTYRDGTMFIPDYQVMSQRFPLLYNVSVDSNGLEIVMIHNNQLNKPQLYLALRKEHKFFGFAEHHFSDKIVVYTVSNKQLKCVILKLGTEVFLSSEAAVIEQQFSVGGLNSAKTFYIDDIVRLF